MTKISKLNIYPFQTPVKGEDYLLGTDGISKATKSFSISSVAQYVADFIGDGGSNATALLSVENIQVDPDTFEITVTNAIYTIKGEQFGPITGIVTETPATDGFYRTDIIVGSTTGEFSIITGQESASLSFAPSVPDGMCLISEINIFGSAITPNIPTLSGWKNYGTLVYLKRNGNFNPNLIQEGDPVWGVMSDGNSLIKGAPYLGTGDYYEVGNYYANPEDISEVPATNTP